MKSTLKHRARVPGDTTPFAPPADADGVNNATTGFVGTVAGDPRRPGQRPAAVGLPDKPPDRHTGTLPARAGQRRPVTAAEEQAPHGFLVDIPNAFCGPVITPPRLREPADRFVAGLANPEPLESTADALKVVLENLGRQIDAQPPQQRSDAWQELMKQFDKIPPGQRIQAYELLHSRIGAVSRNERPDHVCRLISALAHLEQPALRDHAWKHHAQSLSSMPNEAIAGPVIALIGTIHLLPDPALYADRLALLVPAIISMPPPAHSTALKHLIHAVPKIAPGKSRAAAINQILLLLRHEAEPARAAHLRSLIDLTHHCTVQDDINGLLQTVVDAAGQLPGDPHCDVLMWLTRQFRTWQNRQLLKPAVLILGRHMQGAGLPAQALIASEIAAGLLDVLWNLRQGLRNDPIPASTARDFAYCLRAAAVASRVEQENMPGRNDVLAAATALVECAYGQHHLRRKQMLEAHLNTVPPAAHQALLQRLGLPL